MIWGYHYFRKHPNTLQVTITYSTLVKVWKSMTHDKWHTIRPFARSPSANSATYTHSLRRQLLVSLDVITSHPIPTRLGAPSPVEKWKDINGPLLDVIFGWITQALLEKNVEIQHSNLSTLRILNPQSSWLFRRTNTPGSVIEVHSPLHWRVRAG